jgi:hypothetical protein
MGLLGIPYVNNTLGINLFKEKRPYTFFNADDKYGVINDEWYLIVKYDGSINLNKYKANDTYNYSKDFPEVVKIMKTYAESNLQAFQYILRKHLQ